jgi:hypothetical protein
MSLLTTIQMRTGISLQMACDYMKFNSYYNNECRPISQRYSFFKAYVHKKSYHIPNE